MPRPTHKVGFKHKETKAWNNDVDIAVWPPKQWDGKDMPPNVSFPKGAKLVLADGTEVALDDYWTNLQKNEPRQEGGVNEESDDDLDF